MSRIVGYVLFVNDEMTKAIGDFEQVKQAALAYMVYKPRLRVQNTDGRTQKWNYDYELSQWVQQL